MSTKDDEERKRQQGGIGYFPWRWGSEATSGWGPGPLLRRFFHALLTSPEAMFPRVLAGLTIAVGISWLAATEIGRWNAPDGSPLAAPFDPAPAMSPSAFDARTPAESLVRGMAGLWGPVLGMGEAGHDSLNDGAAETPPPPPDDAAKKPGDESASKTADGAAEGTEAGGGQGAAGAGGSGTWAPGSASAAAALGGTHSGDAAAGAAALDAALAQARAGAESPARDMRAGALRSARPQPARSGKGALRQLKFADGQSRLGAATAAPERSYDAAKAAFEGAGTGAGSPIGGAGAGEGGAGISQASTPRGVTGPVAPNGPKLTCPSGYSLDGQSCRPLQGVNKTPYQSQADMAKAFILIGAILAALGLFLATRPVPWMQIVGGMMLGAAAALIIAALAIGADIEKNYGQKPQRQAIDAQAARAAP